MARKKKPSTANRVAGEKVIVAESFTVQGNLVIGPESGWPPPPRSGPTPRGDERPLSLGRLPLPADPNLFVGRGEQVAWLDEAWATGQPHVVQIIADGGVGKSTLVWHWLERLKAAGYAGVRQALDWSFYSQGQHAYATDSRRFFDEAERHFAPLGLALTEEARKDPARTGRAVGEVFVRAGGLLLLDGVEPLQYPPGVNDGRMRDAGLDGLLRYLRTAPPPVPVGPRRLLIVTTRWPIPDLHGHGIRALDLSRLSDEDGAALLEHFQFPSRPGGRLFFSPLGDRDRDRRIRSEFRAAAREYGGHALAMVLLASYLLRRYGGDLAMRRQIPAVPAALREAPSRHARRVMLSYEQFFTAEHANPVYRGCRQVLCLVGLFDRPAPLPLLLALLRQGPIAGLTDGLTEEVFALAVGELRELRLLSRAAERADGALDTHPLIREYFGQLLGHENPSARREAHGRLYEHLGRAAEPFPPSLAAMEPLFQAMAHGCQAGRHRDALYDLYFPRIMRGEEFFAARQLGAFGPLLSVLAPFFEPGDWGRPIAPEPPHSQGLTEADQVIVLNQAAVFLAATRGHADGQVERAYSRARDLCRGGVSDPRLFQILRGLWQVHLMRADYRVARELAGQCLQLARAADDRSLLLESHMALGTTLFYCGEITAARAHLEKELAGYDLRQHRLHGFIYGHDPGVGCLCYTAQARWILGYPEAALRSSQRALALARSLSHSFSLAFGLYFAAQTHQYCGDYDASEPIVDELLVLSEEQGFALFGPLGLSLRACLLVHRAPCREATALLREAFEACRNRGALVGQTCWLGLLAWAAERAGRIEEGLAAVTDALAAAGTTGEHYFESPLYRLKGELLFAQTGRDRDEAAACFRKAIDIARVQEAKSFELEAAVSFGRLLERAGETESALRVVEGSYSWFTEGFQTRLLTQARKLLDELRARSG